MSVSDEIRKRLGDGSDGPKERLYQLELVVGLLAKSVAEGVRLDEPERVLLHEVAHYYFGLMPEADIERPEDT